MSTSLRTYETHARTTPVFGRVLVSSRNHHIVVDGPVGNGCPGEALTPPEIFLGAVASCGAELISVIARDEKVPLGGVEVTVTGSVDRSRQPRTDVTLFNSVHVDITLSGTDGAKAAALVEGFKRR
ncbi:MAG: OsmC family protein [Gemmatimonadaceae bacterium]|nr:OsmC family protein [Gemmatimonadaceae bacterium]NUQ93490.1 OsmC family protein [Gemmatimonadaceae bacterium]NUR19170.1 OsmC family protein [Gemmatimonadaceae bacterium]NUS97663.1 OsmC family protein [Gemmatimonadaceae bacterium]